MTKSLNKIEIKLEVEITQENDNLYYVIVKKDGVETKMPAQSYEAACAVADSSVAGMSSFGLSQSLM